MTTIRIKRSSTTGSPASLKTAELAYSYLAGTQSNGGDRLYVGTGDDGSGNATSIVTIGGKYFTDMLDHAAGTLTASSALIVDANGKLDNLKVDNLDLNGNTITTLDTNGNLILDPNGTGKISFYNLYTFPDTAGTAGYALVSDGAGGITWSSVNSANTATNLAGGTAGGIPYQTGSGATAFIPIGASGSLLQSNGSTATWVGTSTVTVNKSIVATKWETARTLLLSGDLSGSAAFDGSGNFTLTATIAANSVELGTDTTGNYVAAGATSGFGLSGSASTEGSTFTVTANSTSSNVASTIVYRDTSGNFSAGTVTADTAFVGTLGLGGAQNINTNALTLGSYTDAGGILYFSNGSGLVASNSANFAWDAVAGTLRIKTNTTATSTTTGALVVTGGASIGGSLYVGGEIVAQKLTIQYTTVTTTLVVTDDVIQTTNGTQSTSTTSGALQVTGGAGIGGNLYVGGTIFGTITGAITTATNLAGGLTGQIPYQTAPGVTSFLSTSSLTVNAAVYATKWQTARTLTLNGDLTGSVAFDGSGDFSLTATIAANSVALGTDTTGDYVSNGATSGFGISGSTTGENQTFTVTANSTSSNTVSTIVYRDTSGNFSAGTVTANLTGTATTATNLAGGTAGQIPYQTSAGVTSFLNTSSLTVNAAVFATRWQTARTLTLNGDLSGSVAFDGSSNFSLTATIAANSVELGTDTTGNYVAVGATSGFGISGSTTGENQTFTVTANSTSSNTVSTIVYRDTSGNFRANVITADLVGNASTATNLAGGLANQIPYQTAAGVTNFLATGQYGQVLQVVNTATGAVAWGDIDGGVY